MSRSFSTQLAGQIGESLVVAELGRRGIIATAFAGNVPDIDLLAYRDGKTLALQVKAIRSGSVSFDAKRYMQVEFDGDRQLVTEQTSGPNDAMINVFVAIGQAQGDDRFYLIEHRQLRQIIYQNHRSWLAKHGGIRPKNPQSTHTAVSLADLEEFYGNWQALDIYL